MESDQFVETSLRETIKKKKTKLYNDVLLFFWIAHKVEQGGLEKKGTLLKSPS